MRFHDLRHTYRSLMLAPGFRVQEVSQLDGARVDRDDGNRLRPPVPDGLQRADRPLGGLQRRGAGG
jgi:hypothetical protein